jgi:cytochrome c oxidase accessory protein FixG
MNNLPEVTFRDKLSTINQQGERIWVYPKKPFGYYHSKRAWVAFICLTLFFLIPFLKIKGYPLVLFNILERKFIILGSVFWPQDFYIFLLFMLCFFVFVILFTSIYGRFWCGWLCPQTIFMEMVFRKIEYWIEGNYREQIKLDTQPWDFVKLWKKTIKHIIFLIISAFVGCWFLNYVIGYEKLIKAINNGFHTNGIYLIFLCLFILLFYLIFSRLRELACTIVCPYGRLQSVLTTTKTIQIIYDYIRGEPRGKLLKNNNNSSHGDCIDCKLCVKVCPTNIDIRNGAQLECINCTACIDACNYVMKKLNKPPGLIRYDSEDAIKKGEKWKIDMRTILYSLLLTCLIITLTIFIYTRENVDVKVLRLPGVSYQILSNGSIRNFYQIQVSNKSLERVKIEVKSISSENLNVEMVGNALHVDKETKATALVMVEMNCPSNNEFIKDIKLKIFINDKEFKIMTTKFLLPLHSKYELKNERI